jgi:hypothetical protein
MKKRKRWPIVIAEADEAIRPKVSYNQAKDEEGIYDKSVQ